MRINIISFNIIYIDSLLLMFCEVSLKEYDQSQHDARLDCENYIHENDIFDISKVIKQNITHCNTSDITHLRQFRFT